MKLILKTKRSQREHLSGPRKVELMAKLTKNINLNIRIIFFY